MKNIRFNPVDQTTEYSVPSPKPSRDYLPDWYKKMPAFQTDKPEYSKENGIANRTMKLCMPFSDSLSLGYIQETWQDIHFEVEKIDDNTNQFMYYAPTVPRIVDVRETVKYSIPISKEFYQFELVWHPPWYIELPKGYSAIITHPLNRMDLPFYTLTGVIDADTFTQAAENSNFPFLLKQGFTGTIPKGTPMFQIIPFKRDDWKSISNPHNKEEQIKQVQKLRQYFWSGYKKEHWKKKKYE